MTVNIMKTTNCIGRCEYLKISTFCFDCPCFMCDKCEMEYHCILKHNVIKFKNENLQWDDENLISGLFADVRFGRVVHQEVSRVLKPKNNVLTESEKWRCTICKKDNCIKNQKCFQCNFDKKTNDNLVEYAKRLERHAELLSIVCEGLPDGGEIIFENVAKEYLNNNSNKLDFESWFDDVYLNGKLLSLVYEVVDDDNHQMSMEELGAHYSDLVQIKNRELIRRLPRSLVVEDMELNMEPLKLEDINEKNEFTEKIYGREINDDDMWGVIFQKDNYTKFQERLIMVELDLKSTEFVYLLRAFVNNESFSKYLKDSYKSGNVKLCHLRQALLEQVTIDDALTFLRKECSICCQEFPLPEMQSLLTCEHEMCKPCFTSWLEESIIHKYPCKWNCPSCPEDNYKNIDRKLHYYNLRNSLEDKSSKKTLSIFDQKLLHEQLIGSKFFFWCSNDQCENGFEAEGLKGRVECPSCHTDMCVGCKRKWHEKHENVSCQDYEMWILRSESELSSVLKDIGIECPSCGMRYALAAGGCLHFVCKACDTNFCGACYELFILECDLPNCIVGDSIHAHHPRNCLFYIRDRAPEQLEDMLKDTDYPRLAQKSETNCLFVISDKLTMQDMACNDKVHGTTGLCELHYKEYLIQFINRYKIDPADFVNSGDLNLMLFQGLQPQLQKLEQETEDDFIARLKKDVKKLPKFFIPKGLGDNVVNGKDNVIEVAIDVVSLQN